MKRCLLLLAFVAAPAFADTEFYLVDEVAEQSTHIPLRAQARELAAIYHDLARVASVDATLVYSNDPDINAFATDVDGEHLVIVQEGLLGHFGGDRDAVAAVLGHELAHHYADHLTEGRRKQEGIRIFGAILGAVVGAKVGDSSGDLAGVASNVAVNAGAGLLALKFSRNQELEADRLTIDWMIRAGYNPQGMLRLQDRLGALQGSKRKAGMLSTHPGSAKRYKAAQKEIAKLAAPADLLARDAAPLVNDEALAVAGTQVGDATRAALDAELAAFADAMSGAALVPAPPAPREDAEDSGVHIGENVSLGDNVHIGGKPAKDE